MDGTLDFFTWNSNIPITTNLQNTQLTLQGSGIQNDCFFRAISSFTTAGDSTFINDVNKSNAPISQFKKLKVSFTGSVNPNGTNAYIWATPEVAILHDRWRCQTIIRAINAGLTTTLRLGFGNGRDWITKSYEQIYNLPLNISWTGGGNYYYDPDYQYDDAYNGTIIGFEFRLDRDSSLRTVWGSMSNLKIVYTN